MKLLPAVCAAALFASFIPAQADDTPAQAAARAVLEQKLNELDQQPSQAPSILVTQTNVTVIQSNKPAAKVTKAAATPKPVTKPAAPVPQAPAAVAAVRIPASVAPATAAPAVVTPVVVQPSQPAEVTPTIPSPAETKSAAEAAPVPVAAPVVVAPIVVSSNPVKPGVTSPTNVINANVPTKELGLKAIEPPLVPVSAAQEAQLLNLLEKYKANQISPEEYHQRRAEILVQP